MAPRIFIFSIVLSAEYLSYAKSIAAFALTFFGYIISILASVSHQILYPKARKCGHIFKFFFIRSMYEYLPAYGTCLNFFCPLLQRNVHASSGGHALLFGWCPPSPPWFSSGLGIRMHCRLRFRSMART